MSLFNDPNLDQKYTAMKTGGQILARIIYELKDITEPGMSASHLDQIAYQKIIAADSKPAFLGYQGFPNSLIVSLNNEVVHAIPKSHKIINDGDLVTFDLGLYYQGFCTDMAISFILGKNHDPVAQNLLAAAETALDNAVNLIEPGIQIGDLGNIIEKTAKEFKVKVIYDCAGHGVGKKIHEEPTIPNFGRINTGPQLIIGQTVAIEPIFAVTTNYFSHQPDGWTLVTEDGSLAVQAEHTVIITPKGHEILTLR